MYIYISTTYIYIYISTRRLAPITSYPFIFWPLIGGLYNSVYNERKGPTVYNMLIFSWWVSFCNLWSGFKKIHNTFDPHKMGNSFWPLIIAHLIPKRIVGFSTFHSPSPKSKVFKNTLPETNIAPENGPSQTETSIPTIHFQGRTVSFREGNQSGNASTPLSFSARTWSSPLHGDLCLDQKIRGPNQRKNTIQVIQFVTELHPRSLEVTIHPLKGSRFSPSQKGHDRRIARMFGLHFQKFAGYIGY